MEVLGLSTRACLNEPVVVAAFEGWNEAGDAATRAARYLADRWDAQLVADIDPEEFYDCTTTRPVVTLDDDGVRDISWPSTEVYAGSIPGTDRDVVFVVGTEPQLRWRTYSDQLTTIATTLGAQLCITLGALPPAVPHPPPPHLAGTAPTLPLVCGVTL